MYFNPLVTQKVEGERIEDWLRQAESDRLARLSAAHSNADRWLLSVVLFLAWFVHL